MKALLLVLALALVSCGGPSQHDPVRFGTVTVAFGLPLDPAVGPWRPDQLVELRAELLALNALGPSFVEASEASAMIVVRPFDSAVRTGTCHGAAGCYTLGTTFVEVDPAVTAGYTELRAAMGHEVGHFLGLRHVCFTAGELPDCSPVGVGPAIMNPKISYGDVLADNATGDPLGVPTTEPTQLDLAEFTATHP